MYVEVDLAQARTRLSFSTSHIIFTNNYGPATVSINPAI
jgi:hypothetical protein